MGGWREREQVGVQWLLSVDWGGGVGQRGTSLGLSGCFWLSVGVGESGNRLELSGCFRLSVWVGQRGPGWG